LVLKMNRSKNTLKEQTRVFLSVKEQIDAHICLNKAPIDIRCGEFTFKDVVGFSECNKSVKADFILKCRVDSSSGYISHKKTEFSHNGYGSVGLNAFKSRSPYTNQEIWNFAKWAREYCIKNQPGVVQDKVFKWTDKEWRGVWCFPSEDVQNAIVYGPKYGGSYSECNCHLAAVGNGTLKQLPSTQWELKFDGLCSNRHFPYDFLPTTLAGC
jgi:hypothetical protein